MKKNVSDILEKYKEKLDTDDFSIEYKKFKEETLNKELSFYEKACNFCSNILSIKVNEEDRKKLLKSIERVNLKITPEGANSFAFFTGIGIILLGIFLWIIGFLFGKFLLFFPLLFIILGFLSIKLLANKPNRTALKLRMKAGNQMVLCVLYVVMYMRHTSSLEHAVKFAAQHLDEPLSYDLKKVFWDIETGKYSGIKDSLDAYLETWRNYNNDFINSFHLIESSLYEPNENRRLEVLERGLRTILDGNYERMMHYAQDLKSPITMLYMLGVILPILGLIILPLMSAFLGVKWYWLAFFYNLILPIFVYYMGLDLLIKRPSGESEATSIDDKTLEQSKYINIFGIEISPILLVTPLLLIFLFIGFSPLILHYFISKDNFLNSDLFFGYRFQEGNILGPFGLAALFLSLVIPLGLAITLGIYYKLRTYKLMKTRGDSRELEKEFAGSLFQLGNRIEDGLPAELAFEKIAENLKGTKSGDFFRIVAVNIRRLGMSVRESIFNRKRGALLYYPSKVIESTMEILSEGVKKGPKIAAHSLMSISNYMVDVHKVNERLKDLLADILSSMKSQISFLTPLIAGIVVSIANMITNVITNLGPLLKQAGEGEGISKMGIDISLVEEIFPIDRIIPPFYFQLIVGIYLIEIIFILTILANAIENGVDKLNEENLLGKNLYKGVLFYTIVAGIVTIVLWFMARGVINVSGK